MWRFFFNATCYPMHHLNPCGMYSSSIKCVMTFIRFAN